MTGVVPTLIFFCGAPLLIWWLRRTRRAMTSSLKVVSRTALTRNGVVAVIETQGRSFLVGATDHGISLLSELEPDADEGRLSVEPDLTTITDDTESAALPIPLKGPGMSPIETLRAMTARRPVPSRASRAHHRP